MLPRGTGDRAVPPAAPLLRSTPAFRSMSRLTSFGFATLLGLLLAAGASGAPETTEPGIVYRVPVALTDKRITVSHKKYVRGAVIRYAVRNKGTRPYRFVIFGSSTRALRPGQLENVLINWNYRGRFAYKTTYRGRNTGLKGFITIY
jgi:hypothetical protein